jgi:MerR family transcriptional regulator, thiopeptide resistance regulator
MSASFKIIGILEDEESMAYTVKKLSELSGVTVRTLHFYEEAELLTPAYYGSNGYRYYEEKELLQLQQILFFKELGFTLKQIRKVLGRSDFDQLAALYSHKKALSQEWEKIGQLIKTIDKTIKHLKGKKKMKDKDIFHGFIEVTKGKGTESYFAAEEIVGQSVRKTDKPDADTIIKTAHAIFRELVKCIENGQKPTSDEVQRLIRKHHAFTEQIHTATKQVYKAYAQLYQEHPAFRKQLDPFHPKLAEFMATAMKIFADRELS